MKAFSIWGKKLKTKKTKPKKDKQSAAASSSLNTATITLKKKLLKRLLADVDENKNVDDNAKSMSTILMPSSEEEVYNEVIYT